MGANSAEQKAVRDGWSKVVVIKTPKVPKAAGA